MENSESVSYTTDVGIKDLESDKKISFIPTIHYLFGCRFDILVRLLWENRKEIAAKKIPQIFWMLLVALILWPFALIEELVAAVTMYRKPMEKDPMFIVGHWRSGTTFLHYLMDCDPDLVSVMPAATYLNNNYLFLSPIVELILSSKMKSVRHMDNVDSDINSPSEEIFALANRSVKSFMHMQTFPSKFEEYARYAFVQELPLNEQKKVAKNYRKIYKKIYFKNNEKRLLLKSPDHTCHSAWLADEFPKSEFIHIYRNPYKVIRSTINMVSQAHEYLPLEESKTAEELEDLIVDFYVTAHKTLFHDLSVIPKERIVEIKYEDFVAEPVKYMKQIYGHFPGKDFSEVEKQVVEYVESQKDYKKNSFTRNERLIKKINEKAAFVFEHYGYEIEE